MKKEKSHIEAKMETKIALLEEIISAMLFDIIGDGKCPHILYFDDEDPVLKKLDPFCEDCENIKQSKTDDTILYCESLKKAHHCWRIYFEESALQKLFQLKK